MPTSDCAYRVIRNLHFVKNNVCYLFPYFEEVVSTIIWKRKWIGAFCSLTLLYSDLQQNATQEQMSLFGWVLLPLILFWQLGTKTPQHMQGHEKPCQKSFLMFHFLMSDVPLERCGLISPDEKSIKIAEMSYLQILFYFWHRCFHLFETLSFFCCCLIP